MPRPFMVEPYIETQSNLSFFYAPGIGYLQNTRLVWIVLITLLLFLYAGWRLLVASLRCGSRALQDACHSGATPKQRAWASTRLLLLTSPALLVAWGCAGARRTHAHADPDSPGVGRAEIAVPKSADTLSIEYLLKQFHIGSDPDYIMQMVYSQSKLMARQNQQSRLGVLAGRAHVVEDLLNVTEATEVARVVRALRPQWKHHANMAGPLPFFTLGAASYLDAADGTYAARALHANALLQDKLGWLYARVRARLADELGAPVRYHRLRLRGADSATGTAKPALALPGFHVFLANTAFSLPVCRVHIDAQHHHFTADRSDPRLAFPRGADAMQTISFTVAIDLPLLPAVREDIQHDLPGLFAFRLDHAAEEGARSTRHEAGYMDEYGNARQGQYFRVLHPYRVGAMILHDGHLVHQIAPSRWPSGNDARITMQGHGIFDSHAKRWLIYW